MKEYVITAIGVMVVIAALIWLFTGGVDAINNRACISYGESMSVPVRFVGGDCQVQQCDRWFPVYELQFYITELDCQ